MGGLPSEAMNAHKCLYICEVYQQAAAAATQGEVTFSVDENTGIQALQRIAPDRPMKPGRVQEIEFEYKRHGTIGLLAGLEVATGKIEGCCEPTRTENHVDGSVFAPRPNWWSGRRSIRWRMRLINSCAC